MCLLLGWFTMEGTRLMLFASEPLLHSFLAGRSHRSLRFPPESRRDESTMVYSSPRICLRAPKLGFYAVPGWTHQSNVTLPSPPSIIDNYHNTRLHDYICSCLSLCSLSLNTHSSKSNPSTAESHVLATPIKDSKSDRQRL